MASESTTAIAVDNDVGPGDELGEGAVAGNGG